MEEFEVEALVIEKLDIGEGDRIITLFEKNRGKIKVFIKGIRKSKNREIYATDPLVLGIYKLRKKGEMYYNTSLQLKNPFLKIKSNFFKLEISIYILRLIDKIIFENIEAKKIYKLSLNALIYIEETDDKNKIFVMLSYYFYKIIVYEGLKPEIKGKSYFNLREGILEDEKKQYSISLDDREYEYIQKLNKVDIAGINELKFDNKEILKIINILESYLNQNLFLELNILKYLGEEKWI